jgi:hypothetical protein
MSIALLDLQGDRKLQKDIVIVIVFYFKEIQIHINKYIM